MGPVRMCRGVMEVLCMPEKDGKAGRMVEITLTAQSF
jgi:hypothetical protein